ncbi:hypothetical protein GW781_13580 [bacterium]|nr:hypothetical protein [bacterium]NCT22167.1 hypothetical protein [bacterium]
MAQENIVQPDRSRLISPEAACGESTSAPEQPIAQIMAEVAAEAGAQAYSFIP